MNDHDALLRSICEYPAENTPRLMYADWLDEHGGEFESRWAELIRVEVTLNIGAGAERKRLEARDRELTVIVADRWAKWMGLPDDLSCSNWWRGFPHTLAGPGTLIRKARPTFVNRLPFRDFFIEPTTDADVLEIVKWPELSLLLKLTLSESNQLTDSGMLALAACPYLNNLGRLLIRWATLTDANAVIEAFLHSPCIPQVNHQTIYARSEQELSDEVRQLVEYRPGSWFIY